MLSNLEEIAKVYFLSQGYLVAENVLFFLPRETTNKKVSGWSDIDLVCYKKGELLIVQCKEFLGTGKKEKVVERLLEWFKYAEKYVRENQPFKDLIEEYTQFKKVIVVNYKNPPGAVNILNEKGIEVIDMKEMIESILKSVKKKIDKMKNRKTGASGKELNLIRYIFKTLIERKFMREIS